ncbi:4-hydroxythreonine-4-phosphate dehydrogenase PdxA [Phaeobacter inhibens]|uniref:4-hydroxythreonine-4-phosphate dehydrogenase PdxA n=1 Tax=Phaeobacter inhibens TaxID=221822 RepID=UPI00076BB226|nr:4-hydroxythreonine-4-phosphate dehydrogenase PdxA [Phaeobacter inhibens]KXF92325.1 4-hydroxythreonine-4-phosphate dehydrogenase [Phaeobacter inhibens]WHP68005.1 4-hydroxythreonine-4-phosphate dehydrogenase PdxA [Phaeobacter inhibens]
MTKPRIAIVPGDPSGIGPELIAKLVNDAGILEAADVLLVGDSHLWQQGATQTELDVPLNTISEGDISAQSGLSHLEMKTIDSAKVRVAEVTVEGGETSLRCLDKALDLAQEGLVDGVLFGPFNKAAMTSAGLNAEDEHKYMARYLGYEGYHSEINVLDELMTTRVTSHIGLKDVAANISQEGILRAINLASETLRKAGKTRPSIAVAALNPHAGDNGKFGREEIDVLEPAVKKAQEKQMDVTGPWPSDTVFLKAKRGEVDAVVTMYHDQGQIAIKLMGFERGVTVAGGLPIPVATPAHGTAFDIAGQNKANLGATRQAFDLLVRMAKTHRAERSAA